MALRARKPAPVENDEKVIEINAQMQGSLSFNDPVNLKINGDFSGDLQTKGTLTIGEKATIIANIQGENIIVAGKITGDVFAEKMLVLMPTAQVIGNIATPKLNIVEGAVFQGHCNMTGDNLLDITEVSKYLEINIKEIEALANSGQIPGTKEDTGWKFEKSQIDNWASSGKVK
ncbi:MAG: cytoskeletal protein CcmA (bactofilin family) [Lysobacterales bacterium]|jgi:cytoskeletal protein CcmA (bactofilin family)